MTQKQRFAILERYKKMWHDYDPCIPDASGIYILTREDSGYRYAYIGQSKHILTRLAEHWLGYQHIDNSLKNHGLWAKNNNAGWKVEWIRYDESVLDEKEQYFIKLYANAGYQVRNKTAGGQGVGKIEIAEPRAKKGYYDGLQQGYNNARRDVRKWFNYLDYAIKGKQGRIKERMLNRFKDFLEGNDEIKGVGEDCTQCVDRECES